MCGVGKAKNMDSEKDQNFVLKIDCLVESLEEFRRRLPPIDVKLDGLN